MMMMMMLKLIVMVVVATMAMVTVARLAAELADEPRPTSRCGEGARF